ncbi:MAG: tRNA (N6-threonylcarbamoyladenosine(37)-N6)-methyltransferase TrmO [Anaerolineae bacterium]|nr:tRNA (N6-threonylcarbamoyladenosine(37)-N6)-methyltransferase TrmO [Anaerolineae bacterium]
MPEQPILTLRPIGRVIDGSALPPEPGWEEREAVVEVDLAWAGALDGLDGFSHVWLLWWLDAYDAPPGTLRVHPEGREEVPLVGLFATRSPRRPNPLAMTAVRLVELDGRRLRVRGLDARQGTPILDIKPYIRRGDLIPEATMPEWIERLWQCHDADSCSPPQNPV